MYAKMKYTLSSLTSVLLISKICYDNFSIDGTDSSISSQNMVTISFKDFLKNMAAALIC